MPLIRNGSIADDPWITLGDDEPAPAEAPIIVSLQRWRADRDQLAGRNAGLGLRLKSDQSPDEMADDLAHFQVIALEFPSFRDGRAFSSARILREHLGYAGEIRAVGDVTRDRIFFLHRCGFDTFEVAGPMAAEDFAAALNEFDYVYQRTGDGREPVHNLRHASTTAFMDGTAG